VTVGEVAAEGLTPDLGGAVDAVGAGEGLGVAALADDFVPAGGVVGAGIDEATDAGQASSFVGVPKADDVGLEVGLKVVGVVVGLGVHVDDDILAGEGLGDGVDVVEVKLDEARVVVGAARRAGDVKAVGEVLHEGLTNFAGRAGHHHLEPISHELAPRWLVGRGPAPDSEGYRARAHGRRDGRLAGAAAG